LAVCLEGQSIADVLGMTVVEAQAFFSGSRRLRRDGLAALEEAGLGYLTLGQPTSTLSGGEAQRLQLARELAAASGERRLYLLDEPTTGLHLSDVARLVGLLQRLADEGHTLVVVEHHLDVIRSADHVIDLGPEAGADGGRVVAAGTPDQVAECHGSHTGRFLRHAGSLTPNPPSIRETS
jgi:excinuclease ABC subunit A